MFLKKTITLREKNKYQRDISHVMEEIIMRKKIVNIFICLIVFAASLPAVLTKTSVKADPVEGLIAYWTFDEGDGSIVHDSSGYGNDGINNGAVWTTGKFGSALEITGTQFVENIPASFDTPITTAFTVTAWVKWYGPSPYPHDYIIFDGRADKPYGFCFYLRYTTGQLVMHLNDDSTVIYSTLTVPRESWTFVAGVFNDDTDTLRLYINGRQDSTLTTSLQHLDSYHPAMIGNNHWAPGDGQWAPINGIQDEIRIYNRELTASEIYDLYGGSNATDISIDIKPGEYPNTVNPKSHGKLPVAILTTENFNASDVNPESINFLSDSPELWAMEDVDNDSDLDMILHFNIQELDFDLLVDEGGEYPYAYLYGQTSSITPFEGKDTIRLLGELIRELLRAFLSKILELLTSMFAQVNI